MTRRGEERSAYRLLVGETDGGHIEDQGLDSKIILKLMLQKNLAQNRYKRRAVLNTFIDHVSN
jgi:hypothetical protein